MFTFVFSCIKRCSKGGTEKPEKNQKLRKNQILSISIWTLDVPKNQIITFAEAKQDCFVWSGNPSTEILFLRVNQFFSREANHFKGKGDRNILGNHVWQVSVMHSSRTFRTFKCAIPYSVLPSLTMRFFSSNRIINMLTRRRNVIFNGPKMLTVKHFLPCCKLAQWRY